MSEQPKKYLILYSITEVNEAVEQGYRLHTVFQQPPVPTRGLSATFIMSLQEPSKYDNVEKFMKVPITTYEQDVPDGWTIIHHTAKEMVLIEKGDSELVTALKEWYYNQDNNPEENVQGALGIVEDYVDLSKKDTAPSTT